MKHVIAFIFLFFVFSSAYGYEIQGEFKSLKSESEIVEGEAFDSYIRIWPIPNEDLDLLKKELEQKEFISFFYIAKIYSIKYSENNSDVLEIHAKSILKKSYTPREFYIWNYKSLIIPFTLLNITPTANSGGKEFIILNQSVNDFLKKKNVTIYFIFALFTLILGGFLGHKVYLKQKVIRKKKEVDAKWSAIFQSAHTRSDYEYIYSQRKDWVNHLGGETPPMINFFESIGVIQYKQDWSDFEQLQVNDSFDELRGMFERN